MAQSGASFPAPPLPPKMDDGMPHLYPIFLRLAGRPVTIIGGGRVALRKARGLAAAGAVVTVVAPEFAKGLARLPVGRVAEPWRVAHLRGAALVFAATDDPAVNRRVAASARARGIPACVVDDADACDFHVPAVSRRGDLAVAISTGGTSPSLAARLRKQVDHLLTRQASAREKPARASRAAARGRRRPSTSRPPPLH